MSRNLQSLSPVGKPAASERIVSVDILRGIAALAVCYRHLTLSLPEGILRESGSRGGLGVQIFFVISGFVIPYSLHKAGYHLRDYGLFIVKRVVRVDPPYLATIALVIPLGYLCAMTPGFMGPPYSVTCGQVLLHLAYLNAFFGENWVNPVFWTLAIEFQYYLLVGLVFSFISNGSLLVRAGFFLGAGSLALLYSDEAYRPFVTHWLVLFLLGMLVFQRITGQASRREFWIFFAFLVLGTACTLNLLDAAVGGVAALFILFFKKHSQLLLFLGGISYSLYLIHLPTGVKLVNLGVRFTSSWIGQLALLILGLAFSIFAAYLLNRFVEKPAQRWAAKIRYKRTLP